MLGAYDSYWKEFMNDAGPGEPVAGWRAHAEVTLAILTSIPAVKSSHRYAPEKWSIKQLLGHMTDAQLIFMYRLVCIARGETKSLPGFDENAYVEHGDFDSVAWPELIERYRTVALTTSLMIAHLSPEAWERQGEANAIRIQPVEILRVIIGHERHHLRILKERYGIA